ncbi:hypothetical protein VSDG_04945 [Cytospora chrysosperma]|uniref:Uncharacterized protein n=1 Tax=Cytospora chrysosperma TaxID=252740 RepID=A0A423W3L3_CYTCH|nr:hypothetical protein VSDG_04945 [Valsa sordida]
MDEASSDLTKASPATTTINLKVPICIYSTDVTHGLPFREEGKTKRGFRYDGHLHGFPHLNFVAIIMGPGQQVGSSSTGPAAYNIYDPVPKERLETRFDGAILNGNYRKLGK